MTRPPATLCIEDLIGSRVVTAAGERLGPVVDVVVTPAPEYRVSGLELGRYGWLDRFALLRPLAHVLGPRAEPRIVPWEAVDRFEGGTLTLKSGHAG